MSEPIEEIASSRYAARLLAARPELSAELADPAAFARDEMAHALAGAQHDDEAGLKRRFRLLRQRVLLRVMARDLSRRANLDEVCGAMSDLAELEISTALRWLGAEGLVVVGMGKLGGRELNVSSDIDLVFLYPGSADQQERYETAGRRLIRLLAESTEDGFAFRVDMRLRPFGDAGPLACSFDSLETYLIAHGREWERYAWLKARALTGSHHAELMRIVQPFVFRKYLDYATLGAMRRLHAEVRREVARRELAEHVKLGPGGIREVEFVAQALQLVRGGRDPALTVRPTLEVLSVLSKKNLLPEQAARELADAYVLLRNVEHRLQYLDDAQRHDLPADEVDRARLAKMSGFASWEAFSARLQSVRDAVSRHFDSVFAERDAPAAATADPQATLARGVDLVEAIASRAAYLALLAENPQALERVTRIIGASSWAAEFVTRHPLLLDELLDDRLLYAPPELDAFARELRSRLAAHQGDAERRMNLLREMHQAQVFRLLAQDLAGLLGVERLADHLAALADLVLEISLEQVWSELGGRHLEGAPRFAVISYGKLGGKELGYASDLDLIFLYDDAREQAPEAYARLAQRFNNWLTARTPAGVLFDTDLRLRPSGAAGLLVSPIEAFARYQEHDAWVWEHQALSRARYSAGDSRVGQVFESIRERILRRSREPAALAKEILAMREKMHAAHPNKSGLFDIKHDAGGMIDIEFTVQYLLLAHSHEFPSLTINLANIALLGMAAELGLLPQELAERCQVAYREYRRVQHALRLNGAQYARVPHAQAAAHVAAVRELWQHIK